MRITFDPAKNEKNERERGLPFDLVARLDWETSLATIDARRDYGEQRLQVLGKIGERLHMVVITVRDDAIHVISLRKANAKEVVYYANVRG